MKQTQLESEVEAALAAKFTQEQQKHKAVKSFYEMRGLHNRGKIGDCALRTAHEVAKKAVASE